MFHQQNISTACNDLKCLAGCCSGNQCYTVITDNDGSSVGDKCTYHDEEPETDTAPVTSSNSGSLIIPDSDDEIKIDDSNDLYNMTKNSPCYIGDTEGDRDDNNEDSSIDEVYSDYQTGPHEMGHGELYDDPDTLICPGDRVQYCE